MRGRRREAGSGDKRKQKGKSHNVGKGVGQDRNTHPSYCSHLSSHSRRAADLWSTENSSLDFTISGGSLYIFSLFVTSFTVLYVI